MLFLTRSRLIRGTIALVTVKLAKRNRICDAPGLAGTTRYLAVIAVTLGVLLAITSSATAAEPGQVGFPLRKWSVSKIVEGAGKVTLGHSTVRSDDLDKSFNLGPAAFDLGPLPPFPTRAGAWVFSRNDGRAPWVMAQAPVLNRFEPRSPKGGTAHLDQYQVYEKPRRHASSSLEVTINDLLLEMVDNTGPLTHAECPVVGTERCPSLRTIVRFRVRAYPKGGGSDFFDSGGAVYAEGHTHAWTVGAVTLPDSRRPFFPLAEFQVNRDLDHNGGGRHFQLRAIDKSPVFMMVPLRTIAPGQQFVVKVTLDAEAIDDRGHESGAVAFIQDPQHAGPRLIARGLQPRAAIKIPDPPIQPPPPARCSAGPHPNAGTVQLSSSAFTAREASGTPLVLVTRKGGSRGAASVTVTTSGGTARPGQDFTATKTLVRFENRDTSPRLVEIPIREDLTIEHPENFTVSLSHARCMTLGEQRKAVVTILDDDQPPATPPPPPAFTIGGTVDGLQGAGLVLSNLGTELAVSTNGQFTLPGTHTAGEPYEVNVKAQPHNPDQLCTVQSGAGHVGSANVSNIAVHCSTLTTPVGLDTTFGSGGRVSTPVGGSGDGEAVVIQPDGGIVTAGSRGVGTGSDFVLTRHSPDGILDTRFGTNGVAVTDLGGKDDKAYDAALLPDGGIVAVGVADPGGFLKGDFGIVRYNPDGTPNKSFGTDGIVRTDIRGDADQAEAVAVQPDGKIVVAGLAAKVIGTSSDFALVRYNPDGTLDQSFGDHGIVTTDFGGEDAAVALAIQSDGKIVLAGTASDHIALARYASNGTLDITFGSSGTTVNPGNGVINGLALTPGGGILLAGSSGGDFLLTSYAPDGTLNVGFGHFGSVTTDIGGGTDDFAENLVVDAQGRIVLVGRSTSSTILDMTLARYHSDGTLDTTFATNGILTADFHGRGEFGQDAALDAAGRIVAAGYTANGSDTEFALMRANP